MVCRCVELEKTTLQTDNFFDLWSAHEAPIYRAFLTFPTCLKYQMTIVWSMLRSSATSHVVLRGSALMILSVGDCQLLMVGH